MTHTEHSFIANVLVEAGYFVFSIQHDLEKGPSFPKTKNLFERRKPLWERGVKNILSVISYLKKKRPSLKLG